MTLSLKSGYLNLFYLSRNWVFYTHAHLCKCNIELELYWIHLILLINSQCTAFISTGHAVNRTDVVLQYGGGYGSVKV